eukprot:5639999-Amphidinium_carterae.1
MNDETYCESVHLRAEGRVLSLPVTAQVKDLIADRFSEALRCLCLVSIHCIIFSNSMQAFVAVGKMLFFDFSSTARTVHADLDST